MGYMADYYAAKGAENEQGTVNWNQVPIRNGGKLNTGHPEDQDWPPAPQPCS